MKVTLLAAALLIGYAPLIAAHEFHVSKQGADTNDGSASHPFLTISAAANVAQPGDAITVHAGVYRERVNPPRGGASDAERITYQAAPGEAVEIKGSEIVKRWEKVQDDVWKVTLPNAFFGKFNPYSDLIRGDWFLPLDRQHHTGAVYLDGEWFMEAAKLEDVMNPGKLGPDYLLNVASFTVNRGRENPGIIPAESFGDKHGMQTALCSEGGQCLGFIQDGDWARYDKVNFGDNAESVSIRAASVIRGGQIELRLDSPHGELLGTCPVCATNDWQHWFSFTTNIKPTSGVRTLCLVFKAAEPAGRLWYGEVGDSETTIWARFPGVDPNARQTEINVRQSVFYPEKPGRNYLTVRGFTMSNAATPWAPPTAEQIGLIGTNWSKGWIIENNVISHSICSGVTLGKYGDEWDNKGPTSEAYVNTIKRATANGWSGDNVGHHIVRNNTISHCEQTGICGSLGAVFSQIENNDIYDIHVRRFFSGAEMAGIKLHGSIDVLIKGNRIHHTIRAMWMDWMAQGTRISGNLCYDSIDQDVFMEVDHGPYLMDNNLFLSRENVWDMSEGGAYVHNFFGGFILWMPDSSRKTPFLKAHSTQIVDLIENADTDNRFYNNIFSRPALTGAEVYGLSVYDKAKHALHTGGNAYYGGAVPYINEKDAATKSDSNLNLRLTGNTQSSTLTIAKDVAPTSFERVKVTTDLLGETNVSKAAFDNPDSSPLTVGADYFGQPRVDGQIQAGPFVKMPGSGNALEVWPHAAAGKH